MAKFQPIQPKNITEFLRSIQGTLTKEVLILSLVVASLTLLYWSFLEFNFQQSVGKILMRIKVKGTGKKAPTIFQIIIRNVTKLSTVLIIFDTLYMILKKSNQRYFERISKTTVVREDSLV